MTKKVTVITKDDLDNQTVNVSDDNKVVSTFVLTSQEKTIPVSKVQSLIFREAHNSNYRMFCTGFQADNEWYGDRPGDGVWVEPFSGKKYQRTGGVNTSYANTGNTDTGDANTGNTDTGNTDTGNTDTGNANTDYVAKPTTHLKFTIDETYDGVQIRVENSSYTVKNPPPIKGIIYHDGKDIGTPTWEEEDGALVWQSKENVFSRADPVAVQVDFTDGSKYAGSMARTVKHIFAGAYTLDSGNEAMDLKSLLVNNGFKLIS